MIVKIDRSIVKVRSFTEVTAFGFAEFLELLNVFDLLRMLGRGVRALFGYHLKATENLAGAGDVALGFLVAFLVICSLVGLLAIFL